MALLVQRYLSHTASFVLCIVYICVKEHHNLQRYSPLLKKARVRQVVLDKWFPPEISRLGPFSGKATSWGRAEAPRDPGGSFSGPRDLDRLALGDRRAVPQLPAAVAACGVDGALLRQEHRVARAHRKVQDVLGQQHRDLGAGEGEGGRGAGPAGTPEAPSRLPREPAHASHFCSNEKKKKNMH